MPALSTTFEFASASHLSAPPTRVYDILRDVEAWTQWWPQIRRITRHDDETGLVRIRSALPLTLRVLVTREVEDAASGTLRARLAGDLIGWSQFVVRPEGLGARVDYAQVCRVNKPGVRRLAPLLRGPLTLNHAAMMRAGMRGLQARASEVIAG